MTHNFVQRTSNSALMFVIVFHKIFLHIFTQFSILQSSHTLPHIYITFFLAIACSFKYFGKQMLKLYFGQRVKEKV